MEEKTKPTAQKSYLAVIGPTASGKSALAMALAERLGGELVNCDSVQVYRGFDLGAAKPDADEQRRVPHHLIDIRDGHEDYDARTFAYDAEAAIAEIRARQRLPIVVGGTGLYLKALWQDGFHDLPKSEALREELRDQSPEQLRETLERIDPRRAAEIHGNDRFRLQRAVEVATLLGHSVKDLPPPGSKASEAFVIEVSCERKRLQERIALRSSLMLDQGLIEEVRRLLDSGVRRDAKPMQSIGYHEVAQFLDGEIPREDLAERIVVATRQYAKRQETLFRKIPKDFVYSGETDFEPLVDAIQRLLIAR